jgi:hypothetical protein
MRGTKLPLTVWFEALWLVAERKAEGRRLTVKELRERLPAIRNQKSAQRMVILLRRFCLDVWAVRLTFQLAKSDPPIDYYGEAFHQRS